MEEVRDEHDPFTRLRGGDDLLLGREHVRDICRQIPRLPELLDVLLGDEGGLQLALLTGSIHGWRGWWRWERLKFGNWSLKMGKHEKEEGVGKRGNHYPLI